jgi:K+ transport systems, NAD-binding component
MYIVIAAINTLSKRLIGKLEGKHDLVVIEEDEDKCKRLYSSSGATVINKSPSSISALEDAGVTQADIMVSTLKSDNENMVVCSLARKYGVPKVVSRMEDDEYFEAFEIIDAHAIGYTDLLLSEFLSAVEHPYLVKLANLSNDREVLKASISEDSGFIGMTVSQLQARKGFPDDFNITSIIKEDKTLNPDDGIEMEVSDKLIIIGPQSL